MNVEDSPEDVPRTMPDPTPNGTLVPVNPQKLTPAGKRSVRNIAFVWLISLVFIGGAFKLYGVTTRSGSTCQAKQFAYDEIVVGWKIDALPMPTAGFTGETLRSRQLANSVRADRLREKIKKAGSKPSC